MDTLGEVRAREEECEREWRWLIEALNSVARARAEQGDLHAFRIMQQQVVAVGQRRVELMLRRADWSNGISPARRHNVAHGVHRTRGNNKSVWEGMMNDGEVRQLRLRLARVNAEWRLLVRQSGTGRLSRMRELSLRRDALTVALFEAGAPDAAMACHASLHAQQASRTL